MLVVSDPLLADKYRQEGELVLQRAATDKGVTLGLIKVRYRFDVFLQEPTQMFTMAWLPSDPNVDLGHIDFRAKVVTSAWTKPAYVEFNPMIPKPGGKFSWDVAGSPDWDEMFSDGKGGFLTEDEAKAAYRAGFDLSELEIIKVSASIRENHDHLPFGLYVDRCQKARGETSIEKALMKESLEKSLGRPFAERLPEPDDNVYRDWSRIQPSNGFLPRGVKAEVLELRVGKEVFAALRLSFDELPGVQNPQKQLPLDYAKLGVTTTFTWGKSQTKKDTVKKGERWVILRKGPNVAKSPSFMFSMELERAYKEKQEKPVQDDPLSKVDDLAEAEDPIAALQEEWERKQQAKFKREAEQFRKEQKAKGRQLLGEVRVNSNVIEVTAWDHGDEDGDRVEIYLNQELEKTLLLANARRVTRVNLVKGKNVVMIKALNQGSKGPNTASFSVTSEQRAIIRHREWNLKTGESGVLLVIRDDDL